MFTKGLLLGALLGIGDVMASSEPYIDVDVFCDDVMFDAECAEFESLLGDECCEDDGFGLMN